MARWQGEQKAGAWAEAFANGSSLPVAVDGVGWTWDPGGLTVVREVQPVSRGLLVVHMSGLIALDGQSGEELWARDLPLESSVAVTPDGARVVVREGGEPARVSVLDSATGRNRSSFAVPEGTPVHGALVTGEGLLVPSGTGFSAIAFEDGEESWEYRIPEGCLGALDFVPERDWEWPVLTRADRILVAQVCREPSSGAPTTGVTALGAESGDVLWEDPDLFSPGEEREAHDNELTRIRFTSFPGRAEVVIGSGQRYRIVDSGTGGVREMTGRASEDGALSPDALVGLAGEGYVHYSPAGPAGGAPVFTRVSYDGTETTSDVPAALHSLLEADWRPEGRILSLAGGLVFLGCAADASCDRDDPLAAYFSPWEGEDSAAVELPENFNASSYMNSRLLPVPGAVVVYRRLPSGGVGGGLVGLESS